MQDDAYQTREERRRTVLLAGAVVYNRQHFPCRVRNVSASGMQVEIDVPLAPGTPVHADLPRYGRFPAVVAWIEGRMMGLVFPEGAAGGLARFGDAAVRLGLVDPPAGVPADDARVAALPQRR